MKKLKSKLYCRYCRHKIENVHGNRRYCNRTKCEDEYKKRRRKHLKGAKKRWYEKNKLKKNRDKIKKLVKEKQLYVSKNS